MVVSTKGSGRQPKVNNRKIYVDILNIIACVAVIALHCNGLFHMYSPEHQTAWSQSLFVEVVFFFAVPIFLMLSGLTLMNYRNRYDTKTFFKKRLSRVLIPFAIWSVITFCFALANGWIQTDGLRSVWDILIYSRQMPAYWFFPIIIGLYFAIPILSLFIDKIEDGRKYLKYMLVGGAMSFSFLPLIAKLFGISYNEGYDFPLIGAGGFTIFILLGYLLSTTNFFDQMKRRIILYAIAVLCLVFRYMVTLFLTINDGATNTMLSNYVYITSVVPAAAVFVLVKNIDWNKIIKNRTSKMLAAVSSCSLGIYLIHMIVLPIEQVIIGVDNTSWIYRILFIPLTYIVSLITVLITKKIPIVGRRLFP